MISKVLQFSLYFGWLLLSLSFFFKYTKTLQWLGFISLSIASFYLIRNHWELIFHKLQNLTFTLFLFLMFLFWFVIVSPYKMASFEAFLLNYLFHILLFYLLLILAFFHKESERLFLIFWSIFFLVIFSFIVYYVIYISFICSGEGSLSLSAFLRYSKDSLLKGLVVSIPAFVLGLFVSFGFFLNNRDQKRYIFLLVSLIIFIFLIIVGRRAALLSILLSFLLVAFFSKNKKLRKIFQCVLLIAGTILIIFLNQPQGKEIMLKARDDLTLLLSFDYEKWAQAGSMGMRLYIWPLYLKKSIEEPFSGTGLGRRVQKRVLPETNKKALSFEHAHNLFLNLALQAGWHSALLFLLFYIATLKKAYNLWKVSQENPFFTFLFLYLIAFFIMSLFEGMEEGLRFTPFWITSGMIWGFEEHYEEKNRLSS